jgi:hypothetical protein
MQLRVYDIISGTTSHATGINQRSPPNSSSLLTSGPTSSSANPPASSASDAYRDLLIRIQTLETQQNTKISNIQQRVDDLYERVSSLVAFHTQYQSADWGTQLEKLHTEIGRLRIQVHSGSPPSSNIEHSDENRSQLQATQEDPYIPSTESLIKRAVFEGWGKG